MRSILNALGGKVNLAMVLVWTAVLVLAMHVAIILPACNEEPAGVQLTAEEVQRMEKRAGTVSPDGLHLVEWFDAEDHHRGYKWVDPVGVTVVSVWEVTDQAEFEEAMSDHSAGDTIKLQSDTFTLGLNSTPGGLNGHILDDYGAGRPVILLGNQGGGYGTVFALDNTGSVPASATGIGFFLDSGTSSTYTDVALTSSGNGNGATRTWTDILIQHNGTDKCIGLGLNNTDVANQVGPFGDSATGSSLSNTGLVINAGDGPAVLQDVVFLDLGADDCDPDVATVNGGTYTLQRWGEGTSNTGADPAYRLFANPNSETVVSVSGTPCRATVKYKVGWGGYPDTKDLATFEIEYGDEGCTSTKVATDIGSGWYQASFNVPGADCDFSWRPKVTICDGGDRELVVTESCRVEESWTCGICY